LTFLVDTNVISELRKGTACNKNVARWYASVDGNDLYLSVLVLGEIRKGVESLRRRDAGRANELDAWLHDVERAFAGRIFPVDEAIAEVWGRMNAARDYPTVDSLLAATAQVHRKTLVTRDTADVEGLGVSLLNPFKPG
jgi:hypothetical protein